MVQTSSSPPPIIGAEFESSEQLISVVVKIANTNKDFKFFILFVVNFFPKLHSIATIID